MSGFRLVLVGWGAIGTRIFQILQERRAPVSLIGLGLRDPQKAGLPPDLTVITSPTDLVSLRPDLVVEVAGRAVVMPWARGAFAAGADFAPASTSALMDDGVLPELENLARAARRQVLISPGAIGGIDALAAAARLPIQTVQHDIRKPPAAWQGTLAQTLCNLETLKEPVVFYHGTASDASRKFPQNANVAAISALSGIGPDRTDVRLIADPEATLNCHTVTVTGDFGRMTITLENRPMAQNPKTSELTALALVRLIENRVSPIAI